MAQLVELGGGPVNATEREIVQRLLRDLPGGWSIIPNASIPDERTGHAYEYDAIAVGPHAVYAIEVKGWRGRIVQLGAADWQLGQGRIERNPLPLADQKARVLASRLRGSGLKMPPPYVQACLVCGSDKTDFDVHGPDARRCLRPSELVPYLTDPSQLGGRPSSRRYNAVHRQLVQAICGSLEARKTVGRRYGSYATTSLQDRDEQRSTWLARHALLNDGRVYRIRAWHLSDYRYTPEQRDRERDRLMRAAKALSLVGQHPNIATLRDFGQADGEFYEVTDWSANGTLQTALVRGAVGRMTEQQGVALIRGIASGLDACFERRVFHRALSPTSVILGADGNARLTEFDLAFMEDCESTVYGGRNVTRAEFIAPELRNPADYDVFDSSDLYSLGQIAIRMLSDSLPAPVRELMVDCTAEEPGQRPANPGELLRLLDSACGGTPAAGTKESTVFDGSQVPIGTVIDGVNVVLEVLGEGEGATVLRVANEPLSSELALKLVTSQSGGHDPALEYRILKAIDHPNVPDAYWLGRTRMSDGEEAPYLLLELVEGPSLADRLADGAIDLRLVLQWVGELLSVVQALSESGDVGFVHRDIKAANVLVGPAGATLVDFGSAQACEDAGHAPTGNLGSIPPDLPETGWEPQCDVFAVACLGYQLISNTPPWTGQPTVDPSPSSLDSLREDVGPAVAAVFDRALKPQASDRFGDAAEFADALSQAISSDSDDVTAAEPPVDVRVRTQTVAAAVQSAGEAIWTPTRIRALTRHPDLAVPLVRSLLDCVVPPTGSSPDELRDALLASEARAAALEAPLPETMPQLYSALCNGFPPALLEAAVDDESAAAPLQPAPDDTFLWFDAIHFLEWSRILEAIETLEREVELWAWAPALDAEPASAFATQPHFAVHELPAGKRSATSLGSLLVERARIVEDRLVDIRPGAVWIGASAGLAYFGHGLRRDVGFGLGESADNARGAWAAAFGAERSRPCGTRLACELSSSTREHAGREYPVGRLAWPDSAATPWLQTGGLGVSERVLPIVRVERGAR